MKRLKRYLFYFMLALGIALSAFVASIFLFKDQIIRQFVAEANKSLGTPVKIGKIDVSAWSAFPNLAIEFSDVYIEDSHPGNYPLLTAAKVSFLLNPLEVWEGNYSIKGLRVQQSETNLKINAEGISNYIILKSDTETKDRKGIQFDLRNVRLSGTRVSYHDLSRGQHHAFTSENLTASIRATHQLYYIAAAGQVTIEKIGIQKQELLNMKSFDITADLVYNHLEKDLRINPSLLTLRGSPFDITGTYQFKDRNLIDIHCDGKDTDIQTLLSLLPEHISGPLARYESDGEVYFGLDLKGEISKNRSPSLAIRFGCSQTTLFHPTYQSRIENANLEGSFATPSLTNLNDAVLYLKNVSGDLNGRSFQTNLAIRNLTNPYVSFVFKGDLDASSLVNLYPLKEIKELTGDIGIDFSLEGKTELLKKKATAQQVKASGTVDMRHLSFLVGERNIRFENWSGVLGFNNNDLALSNVRGKLENSDFTLNGSFKNIITFLLFDNQPIGIETDLKADVIDLDQLFEMSFGKQNTPDYHFSISPHLYLNFNCDIKSLHYKRFRSSGLTGNLLIKNQTAVARQIHFRAMGGSLQWNGIVDAKNNNAIDVVTSFKLNGVHLDSAFYVFENFRQDFIEDKHLKGQAYADVELEMTLNEKLGLIPETLIANISTTIKNGELNNFEPLHKLDKYLDDDGLDRLRFANLTNDIHIENKTVYVPQMEISSNVTTIQVSGTHTFDQRIDYRVIAPLRNRKKIDPDEAFGAIEDSGSGKSKIFLRITGTAKDYRIAYDTEAVKKKIVSDLKKEVTELKEAFRLKGVKKKKELELESDDYFDWPTDSIPKN